MVYYFSKTFTEFDLTNVDYYKCSNCGFVASKTHSMMSVENWESLNFKAHSYYNSIDNNPNNQPPPYMEQALMLHIMRKHEIIPSENWLDWGSGEAKLAKILYHWFDQKLTCFDKYIEPEINPLRGGVPSGFKYDVIINSAVFEHVTVRATLDEINDCVSEKGVLAIHTLVREEIPSDKDWFYLLPVHCSFHTNKSMDILFKEWGYKSSTYCPNAKMWMFFKFKKGQIADKVNDINKMIGFKYLFLKDGFMDYWK